jgi:competence protein ComEA
MTRSTPRPLWGWIAPVRLWLAAIGAIAALGLIAGEQIPAGPPPAPPRLIVDPNTAPPAVLQALPRLGPALVARIVEARQETPFRSLDDLDARVRGIGPATIAALRPYLRIEQSAAATATDPPPDRASRPSRVAQSP